MKIQNSEWEKIFATEASNTELISKIWKQLMQLNIKNKQSNQTMSGRFKNLIFLQRHTDGQQTWKDAQIVRKVQIKAIMRYHFTPVRMAIMKKSTNNKYWRGYGKKDTIGGNINWCSHYGKQYGCSLKNLKIELPGDPAIPLLVIYPEKTISSV